MTGTAFAKRVEGILSRAGTRFGAGQLRGTLTRVTGHSGPSYAPTGETTASYEFVCIWGEFSAEERAAGLVEDGDHKLLIGATTLTVQPRPGDKVTVSGAIYNVKEVGTVKPGGTALLYSVVVRE